MPQRHQKARTTDCQSYLSEAKTLLREARSLFQHQPSEAELTAKICEAINAIDSLMFHLNSEQ